MSNSKQGAGGRAPKGRAASPAGPLDLRGYAPFYLGAIANKWTALSSNEYRAAFDLGIGEWRILASLAVMGSATSLAVATLVKMDPGAVSRGLRVLEERALVQPLPGRFAGRSRPYEMTAAGQEMHATLQAMALRREQRLLEPLSMPERKELLRLLARLYDHLEDVEV
jgi:DNA-binding MarR family transcriptional regulator